MRYLSTKKQSDVFTADCFCKCKPENYVNISIVAYSTEKLTELFEKMNIVWAYDTLEWDDNVAWACDGKVISFYDAEDVAKLSNISIEEAKKVCYEDFQRRKAGNEI